MKTENLILHTGWIKTKSLDIGWYYSNDQMGRYEELMDGKYHGVDKRWYSNGGLRCHRVYENGELVNRIL